MGNTSEKPSTANAISYSVKNLHGIKEKIGKRVGNRNNTITSSQNTMSSPSEFNLHLSKIREKEVEVKKAMETSEQLIRIKGQLSARHLQEMST